MSSMERMSGQEALLNGELIVDRTGLDDILELAAETEKTIYKLEEKDNYSHSPENRNELLRFRTQKQVIEGVLSAIFPKEEGYWEERIRERLDSSS